MAYRTTLPVIDSKGAAYWAENAFPSRHTLTVELVAARDGRTRWRRLSPGEPVRSLQVSVTLLTADLLAVAFESRVQGRRPSDGRLVWSRDLHADLAPELRKAGLAPANLQPGITARLGRSLITAAAASYTDAWLTATTSDGTLRWKTRIAGPVVRMASDGVAPLRSILPESF